MSMQVLFYDLNLSMRLILKCMNTVKVMGFLEFEVNYKLLKLNFYGLCMKDAS